MSPLTINVPVVYMAWDVMIFDVGKSISRAIGGGGPWKSRLFWATPSNGPSNGFFHIKVQAPLQRNLAQVCDLYCNQHLGSSSKPTCLSAEKSLLHVHNPPIQSLLRVGGRTVLPAM